MPKKPGKDDVVRINMRAPASWVARINVWRRRQPDPIPNFSEAVRTLADLGMDKPAVSRELKRREGKK